MDIRGALSKLDPTNEDQWTGDNLPRVEVLQAMGLKGVTRGQITAAAPGFTRFNTTLDPDGEDAPEGAEPEPPAPETNLNMESSEFGGSAPAGSENPPPPPPPPDPEAAKAALKAADEALAKAQVAAEAAKDAERRAQRLRDQALEQLERERTPNEKQMILMGYLNSVAPSKDPAVQKATEPAPIDRAHQRPMGYGKQRPNYPTTR